MMIAVFVAMRGELCGLPKKCKLTKKSAKDLLIYEGNYGSIELILVKTGVGATAAKRATTIVIERYSPQLILSVGTAGAVNEKLDLGDLIVCEQVFCQDQKLPPISSAPTYFQLALTKGKGAVHRGNALTVNRVVVLLKDKKQISQSSTVDIVEMESYCIGQVATTHNVPFLTVRVVSDTATERIADYNHPAKLLYNPIEWWRIGRSIFHGRQALKSLESFILSFLEAVQ